ncbi:MAG TPA: hypothetical protein VHI51_08645, partial [Ktedonobacterales bacterium]|nr:hypothetical protein [Ktedonobacterales bacterium]
HRFEWTRAECRAWAERVATTYGYALTWQGIGPDDPEVGAPSQMVIFDLNPHEAQVEKEATA